jgi:hypothetical protein
MKTLGAIALLLATSVSLTAQSRNLIKKDQIDSDVPYNGPRNFALPTACDEQGRLYVKLVDPNQAEMVGPIYRLSSKGGLEATFDTSGELMNRYAVRPDGGMAMVRLDGKTKVIDNFAPDGPRQSSLRLEDPSTAFFPDQMAVFRSGEVLLSGMQYRRGNTAWTAIYDPAGHLVKEFVLDGDAEVERPAVSRSAVVRGDDGFVYLMRATSPARVYVISSTGEVARQITVEPPEGGTPDFGIRVFKNHMVIRFRLNCLSAGTGTHCDGTEYRVLDATTGKQLAIYRTDNTASGPIACYRPNPDRFQIFSMPTAGKLEIIEAEPQ